MKYILLLILCALVLSPDLTHAQTATPKTGPTKTSTPLPTDASAFDSLSKQISDLKEKIASRVASMNLVEKRGFIGTVTDATNTQLTLTDQNGNIRFVDIDEITKFSSPTAKAKNGFGISDIKKGDTLSLLGIYNKQSRRLLARFVNVVTVPVFVIGTISNVNRQDFTISVTSEKNTYVIDIENTTRTQSLEDGEVVRSGFSKLELGDKVVLVGYSDEEDEKKLAGSFILKLSPTTQPAEDENTVSPTPTKRVIQ